MAALLVVLVLVLLPLVVMPRMVSGMMGGGMMGGNTGWGWVQMLLFWTLLIGGVVALVAWAVGRMGPSSGRDAATPHEALEMLRQRYARGEITAEQFERMKRDLAS